MVLTLKITKSKNQVKNLIQFQVKKTRKSLPSKKMKKLKPVTLVVKDLT